jgi:hypothetical protein
MTAWREKIISLSLRKVKLKFAALHARALSELRDRRCAGHFGGAHARVDRLASPQHVTPLQYTATSARRIVAMQANMQFDRLSD